MTVELLTPILDDGVHNTNFFQGRLLSAEDLRTDQEANRRHRRQLGRAVGTGIVEGLEVTIERDGADGTTPLLRIRRGLALNRLGQTLELPNDESLALVRADATPPAEAGLFKDCRSVDTTLIPTGTGIYVLVISPASGFRERAPRSGLDSGGKAIGCGSRFAVEGVQFRLEQIHPGEFDGIAQSTRDRLQTLLAAGNPAGLSQLRNLLAHLCFGSERLAGFAADPFQRLKGNSAYSTYGALDTLRAAKRLGDCDLPLALFHWTPSGITFLDLWSVRRRPIPLAPSQQWPLLTGQRARIETEAMFLQFQHQLEQLLSEIANPGTLQADAYFRFLPPLGLLPLHTANRPQGVDLTTFFTGKTVRGPDTIDGVVLRALMSRALDFPALDLSSAEALRLYRVRQNEQATAQPYALFVHGHLSFPGAARYDLAYADFANFARGSDSTEEI